MALALFLFFFAGIVPSVAETISIGTFSFDALIPGGATPGVNGFSIANLTGSFALPPDFPSLTPVLLDTTVTLFSAGGATYVIGLGSLGPDFYLPPTLQFPDTELFLSAFLSADISPLQLLLADGRLLTIQESHIQVPLTPTLGTTLTPGVDLAVITVEADNLAMVPEPATFGTASVLILGVLLLRRRG